MSLSTVDEVPKKVIKSADVTMQNALLLQQQVHHQLELENQYRRKRKERTRHFIRDGGSLTVAEVREKEEEQRREMERDAQPRSRRPPTCSDCGVFGHKRTQCPKR